MFTATRATVVTPTDGAAVRFRALHIGTAGNVTVILAGDTTAVTFNSVPAGTRMDIAVKEVKATGTTATNIVGLR